MAEKGVVWGQTAAKQIAKTVREVARRTVNEKPRRGRWQQQRGSSGGGHTMWFTIVDVLCPDGYEITEKALVVVPTWYTGACGVVAPGANYEGTFYVYDHCGYLLDQVDEDLIGTAGRATYFYPYTSDPYDVPECLPRWILSDLCSIPECQ